MNNKKLFCGVLFLSLLVGCGRESSLNQTDSLALQSALSSHLGDSALSNPVAQEELAQVTREIHLGIAKAFFPQVQAPTTRFLGTGCNPSIKLVLIGVSVVFTPSSSCALSGSISVTAFPFKASAKLDVVGLSAVKSVTFDAVISLSNGLNGSKLNLVYKEATFSLAGIKILPLEKVLSSGIVALSFSSGKLSIDSRLNAFEATTKLGVALLGKIDPAGNVRTIQSCLLSNGSATDPQGGTLGACFRIGGGA
jgi:hypothetical protein